ncbi:MAG: pyrroline-5-carboxylate reductase [Muribaculaceae bacterium]|nr:pyrroline-5-carboxylate reductase [Muribaculaceae bacterium]
MKVTVIGAGNMGGALIHGWAKNGELEAITITAKHEATLAPFAQAYPDINTTTDNVAAVKDADVVVLAVKPWIMDAVIDEIKSVLDLAKQIVVSVAANYTTEMLAARLQCGVANLFYVMPNIAAEYGASMSFVARGGAASDEATAQVKALFELCGDVEVVPESQVEAGMMMAGCGIAYVMRYIRAQMEAGVEMGFYPHQAKQIALQTMLGAVSLLKETGLHPEEAIDKVTTPGGITIKGLNELDHAGFNSAVIRSLKAGLKKKV